MAVTRMFIVHNKEGNSAKRCISSAVRYVLDPKKTDDGEYISCSGCEKHTAAMQFLLQYNRYSYTHGKKAMNDIMAFHVIQSFKPGEISPEDANKLGYELASRLLKGKYDFIVSTHVDHLHVHNHIIFSAVSNDCKNKFRDNIDLWKKIRLLSNRICTEHQLSVIEKEPGKLVKYNVWLEEHKDRPQLLQDVNKALEEKGTGYHIWAGKHNIQQLANSYNYMSENGIENVSELENTVHENNRRIMLLKHQAQIIEESLDNAVNMKNHLLNYVKYKEVYVEYKERGYDDTFYKDHVKEIDLVKAAKKSFREYGNEKLPSVRDINEEISSLESEKNKVYTELKELAGETKDLYNYADNIKTLLGDYSEQPMKEKIQKQER